MTAAERSHLHLVHDATRPPETVALSTWTRRIIQASHAFTDENNVGLSTHHTSAWRQVLRPNGTLTVITNRAIHPSQSQYNAAAAYIHTGKGIMRLAAGYDNREGWGMNVLTLPNSQEAITVAEAFFDVDMHFVHTPDDLLQEVRAFGIPQNNTPSRLANAAQQTIRAMQRADNPTLRERTKRRVQQAAAVLYDFVLPE